MEIRTFKKGIHPPHNKRTDGAELTECPAPDTVYIPLAQHIGKPAALCVAVGDTVKAEQGSDAADLVLRVVTSDGFVSANVFSSVSGTVRAVLRRKTPTGGCDHVVIENDGRYESESLPQMTSRDRDALLSRITDAGLVGMGGAGFPTHVKFSPKNPVDTFII